MHCYSCKELYRTQYRVVRTFQLLSGVINQLTFCRCPGTGKWVESDPTSRLNYAQRTVQRRAALEDLGWDGARSQASAPGTLLPPPRASAAGAAPAAKRERKGVSRLPADIRTELADKVLHCIPCQDPLRPSHPSKPASAFLLLSIRRPGGP